MKIRRYIHKDSSYVDYFGDSSIEEGENFYWYSGEDKIGIMPKLSVISSDFIRGVLADNDKLLIYPNQQKIQREKSPKGAIVGAKEGLEETSKLIKFILNNNLTHMFFSSAKLNSYAGILSFSLKEPSKEFYKNITPDLEILLKK